VRRAHQEAFIRDDVPIMVATIAFGMGINKPNARFVLHYDLPKSIEGYYQEIGRAGRDDLPAHCLLLYNSSDAAKQRHFIGQKAGDERRVAVQHLTAIVQYAEGEQVCRRQPLLTYFGEPYAAANCQNCDVCANAPATQTDITLPAQKFLSCVKRTGEHFGAGHVVAVLRGSRNEKVLKYKHDQLSTYNIGADLTEKQWLHLARQMAQLGYVRQDGEHRALSLTPKALDALKHRAPIFGQLQEPERASKSARSQEVPEHDAALFGLLRQKRKALAAAAGAPPHVIFSDRTLVEMAAYLPQSPESLLNISGVGQVKARQYGATFLDLITAYCRTNNLAERPKEARRDKSDAGRRYMIVSEAYNAGASVEQLMRQYGVTAGTILDHLARYVAAGQRLRAGDDLRAVSMLTPEEQATVCAAFDELGAQYLKPVFDKLEGKVTYDALKVMRIVYQLQSGK
jgi:ATP-dependent DNA helicase RecQ